MRTTAMLAFWLMTLIPILPSTVGAGPFIPSDLQVSEISGHSARIRFRTPAVPSRGFVKWGPGFSFSTPLEDDFAEQHDIVVDFAPFHDQQINFRFGAIDQADQVGSSETRFLYLDDKGAAWRYFEPAVNSPEQRADFSIVTTDDGRMIIWGGRSPITFGLATGAIYDAATDSWRPTSSIGAPDPRYWQTAVWTGQEMILWGGIRTTYPAGETDEGAIYNPETDTWRPISRVGAPSPRQSHIAVWDNLHQKMIVWGGWYSGVPQEVYSDGALYDPATDQWTPMNPAGPGKRAAFAGVWTGEKMIVWGGHNLISPLNSGGVYDPGSNTWAAIPTVGAPLSRAGHTAVWTGQQMIVWGGLNQGTPLSTGGMYNPQTATWTPTSTGPNVPLPSGGHSAVWSGARMLIWGGLDGAGFHNSGGRFDPQSNSWSPISSVASPGVSFQHSAVWLGNKMIVWGGSLEGGSSAGGAYEPTTDVWSSITHDTPYPANSGKGVWTGSEMLVWGGIEQSFVPPVNRGSRFNPLTNEWNEMSRTNAPAGRQSHSVIWTGTEMIVWGGNAAVVDDPINGTMEFGNTGGRYDPSADTWTATSLVGAPVSRALHTGLWTGNEMIVWGGAHTSTPLKSGGIYSPQTDSWKPTSTLGSVPIARYWHSAVWTGSKMIVWGGNVDSDFSYIPTNTGGVYDLATDSWSPTSLVGAPQPRAWHVAVWTGSRMLVWGGSDRSNFQTIDYSNGGMYDPETNSWTPVTDVNAPTFLNGFAVTTGGFWTGQQLLVVRGGSTYGSQYEGLYDPSTDSWQPLHNNGGTYSWSPAAFVWAGSQVIFYGGLSSQLFEGQLGKPFTTSRYSIFDVPGFSRVSK